METKNEFELYLEEHPIYEKIKFGSSKTDCDEPLTPTLVMSQVIIDSFLKNGDNRISLIMPDDNLNVLPLIITKYFSNLQDDITYSENILDDLQEGQHIRLGKAVAEFISVDYDEGTIKVAAGGKNERCTETNILRNYLFHLYFEKTDGELSSYKRWAEAKKTIRENIEKTGMGDIFALKSKRTYLNKTIVVIAPKNKARQYLDDLYVCEQHFSDVVSYGELNLKSLKNGGKPYRLYNKGKLDCLPAIIITSKLSDLNAALKIPEFKEKVATIISTQDKLDEITDNIDGLIKCLRNEIPFISFVPEHSFEAFQQLSELGFEFWHWKPSTIKNYDFETVNREEGKSLFSDFSFRVKNASSAQYSVVKCSSDLLKQSKLLIKNISQMLIDADRELRQITYKMNSLHKLIASVVSPASKEMILEEKNLYEQICSIWNKYRGYYTDQPVEASVNAIIEIFEILLASDEMPKEKALKGFFEKLNETDKMLIVVVPDGYLSKTTLLETINAVKGSSRTFVLELNEFYAFTENHNVCADYVLVTWFNKYEYIKIKQTYCYKELVFVLYDYENSWRSGYIKRFDSCLPHEKLVRTAKKIGFSTKTISEKPVDQVDETPYSEIGDYNFDRDLLLTAVGNSKSSYDSSEAVEVVPILFKSNEIGFFTINHKLIDITDLCAGDGEYPIHKSVEKISKGNIVVIRESNKDLVFEIADEIMLKAGRLDLRKKAEEWVLLLQDYSKGKTISFINNEIGKYDVVCSEQQIRNWLLGETICPRDKNCLIALGKMAGNTQFLENVDEIFIAGNEVRKIHQIAGKELTKQLRLRANELKTAAINGKVSVTVEGIGKVKILTVEEVFDKEIANRSQINRLEAM